MEYKIEAEPQNDHSPDQRRQRCSLLSLHVEWLSRERLVELRASAARAAQSRSEALVEEGADANGDRRAPRMLPEDRVERPALIPTRMSVEIQFPLEFIVRGTPVSLQAARARSREAWKQRVKEASYDALPEGHFSTQGPVSVTLFYFPDTEMQGDVDNIVKPILDALSNHIYNDDRQVERVWVQKFEPGRIFQFTRPTEVLSEALNGEKPLLFVRLGDNPAEGLI